jgi:hypothetical protein
MTSRDMVLDILRSTESNEGVEMSNFFHAHNYYSSVDSCNGVALGILEPCTVSCSFASDDLVVEAAAAADDNDDDESKNFRSVTPPSDSNNSDDSFHSPFGAAKYEQNVKAALHQVRKWDVLYGRGSGTYLHEGNRHFFWQLVSQSQEAHKSAPKEYKTGISRGIVATISRLGGRFLKNGCEIDPHEARKKVVQKPSGNMARRIPKTQSFRAARKVDRLDGCMELDGLRNRVNSLLRSRSISRKIREEKRIIIITTTTTTTSTTTTNEYLCIYIFLSLMTVSCRDIFF